MPSRIREIWTGSRWLVIAFILAAMVTLFFGMSAFRHARDFGAAPDQPIAAWMTPRYIVHSWDVPRDVMTQAIGIDPTVRPGPKSLDRIASDQGIPTDVLIRRIEDAIAAHRAGSQ